MALLSSTGISSGLDVNAIVKSTGDVARVPLTRLQQQASAIQTRISAVGDLKSKTQMLQEAATTLASSATWSTIDAHSSSADIVVSNAHNATAASSFSVQVISVAQAQAVVSGVVSPSNGGLGPGTLRLEGGQWAATSASFTPSQSSPLDISVAANDTVSNIAEKINALGSGIKASVLSDSRGDRLFLQGTSGSSNGFRMSVLDTNGNTTTSSPLAVLTNGMTTGQYAQNANITVDGVGLSSSTNTFTGVAGVSLTVNNVTSSPVRVDMVRNNTVINEAVSKFAAAYNALNTRLNDLLKYDPVTKNGGALQGDASSIALQSTLRNALSKSMAATNASTTGLTVERGGNLSINTDKFAASLNAPDLVKAMFVSSQAQPNGIATIVKQTASAAYASDGPLTTKLLVYTDILKRNLKNQSLVSDKATKLEDTTRAKYQALDLQLTRWQALNAYWTQQNSIK